MEIRNSVFRLSRTYQHPKELESSGASDILEEWVEIIYLTLVDMEVGPMFVFV